MSTEHSARRRRERPIALLRAVVSGDPSAWQSFVEDYYGFLFALAKPYSRGDMDQAAELVLLALEGLVKPDAEGKSCYRLRKYLNSLEKFGSRSKFSTWLALVVKNIWRDWFRRREGRRLLPKEIERLGEKSQHLFQALLWDGMSEREALAHLQSRWPNVDQEEADRLLEEVYSCLADHKLYRIYQDLLRRISPVTIDGPARGEGGFVLPDGSPQSRPDHVLKRRGDLVVAERIAAALDEALASLPQVTMQVVGLIMVRGMTGEQVRRVMGFRSRQRVYDEMARGKRMIRSRLKRAGVDAQDVAAAEGLLDGLLEKNLRESSQISGEMPS